MRKRKQPPLGPARAVRSIPVTSDEPVRDRRPLIPLDPALADLASGLLPGATGSEPAAWTSWALRDQPIHDGFSYWESPVVDGDTCSGGGVGFPEAPTDTTPITIEDVTSAAAAGWPCDPGATAPTRSWLNTVAGIGLESTHVSAVTDRGGTERGFAEQSTSAMPAFHPSDVHDAMALHPSARPVPEPEGDPASPPVGAPALDARDFMARLERGASLALAEPQLHALAARAIDRLVPHSTSVWLSEQPSGRLTVSLAAGDSPHAGCGVVERQSCPAIVSGAVQRFDRSDELDACPQLLAANLAPCAAVCVPVGAPGPLRGVLFVSRRPTTPLDAVAVTLLEHAASTIARRAAEVRDAMSSTDSD